MNGKINRVILRIIKIMNVVLIALPFAMCWMGYYANRTWAPFYAKGNYLVIALFVCLYVLFANIYDGFHVSVNRISELIYSQGLATFIGNAVMYIVFWLLTKHLPNILPLFIAFVAQIALSAIWSVLAHKFYFHTFPPKKTAVIYGKREGLENLLNEYGLNKKFDVVNISRIDECFEQRMECLKDVETVFICGIGSHDRNIILKYCVQENIVTYIIPSTGDVIMSGAKHMHMLHLPILKVGRYAPSAEYRWAKRVIDVMVSGLALIVLSPVFLVTAIAIKISDGGPVFYKQCRLTVNGKRFNILKFRSMRLNAEEDGVARLSTGEKDDRVTPVGRIIRKVRIDELPQLLNILRGDMSLVGPRPERPEIAKEYEKEVPEFSLRLQAKAGLTGYAQVYGKYNTTPFDKLQMDLMYIAKPSLIEDLRIIMATIKILLLPESTEGVADENSTNNFFG